MNLWKITGEHAIRIAERDGVRLRKHSDPVTGYQDNVSIAEARDIARADASLIYCVVLPVGWTGPAEGYRVEDYFPGSLGGLEYLGPDEDGIEPTWLDAEEEDAE